MNLQEIMDSIYVLPILLEHLEKSTEDTRRVLVEKGVHEETIVQAKAIKPLLQYHEHFIRYVGADYKQLREGLRLYWNEHLSSMFRQIGLVDKKGNFLDYGCGAGQASIRFAIDNPEAKILMIDKDDSNPCITYVDFEQNPDWHNQYLGTQDWVFMSELLHCKSPIVQRYLMHSAWMLLKEKSGELIIVENDDPIMTYRINKLKGTSYKSIDLNDIDKLCRGRFHILSITTIKQHNIYRYARIQ